RCEPPRGTPHRAGWGPFEGKTPPHEIGMACELGAEPVDIARVEQVDSTPEVGVITSLVTRYVGIGALEISHGGARQELTRSFLCLPKGHQRIEAAGAPRR